MMPHGSIRFKAASSILSATLGLPLILLATIPLVITALAADRTTEADHSPLVPITLQLRGRHQFQFAGYYAAKEKGFYRDAGIDVTIVAGEPRRQPVNEVLAGRAQFGTANSEVLYRRLKGQPLVALAAIFQHSATILLAKKDSEIRNPHDLRGRDVMTTGEPEILAMIRSEGIDPDEVGFRESSYEIGDLVAGKTDAFNAYLTNEPYFMNELGIPYIALKPSTYGIDFYSDILFTTEKEIRNQPGQVKRFREASLRGWQYAMRHADEIIDLIKSRYRSDKTRQQLQFEANAMRQLVDQDKVEVGHMNPGRWRHMADVFVTEGMIDPGYSLTGFIYDPNAPKDLIVFLGDESFAPYEFYDNEKPVGANVDFINTLGTVLGRPVEVRLYEWEDAKARFQRGEGHALTMANINSDRKEIYDFTQSTFTLEFVLFVKSQHHDRFDVRDLSNKRIAVKRGGFPQSIIEDHHPEAEIVVVDNVLQGFELLSKGDVEGVIEENLVGHHTLEQNKIKGIEALQTPLGNRTIHIPVIKGNSAFLEELNEAISTLKSMGKIEAILRRWSGGPVLFITGGEKDAALIGAAVTLAVVAMLATLLFFSVAKRNREHTLAEGQLQASLAEKEVLIREVHHRVKNNLQIISSMLSLQAGTATDSRSVKALRESQRRVKVMARIHENLHQSDDLTSIDVRGYLNTVVEDTGASSGDDARPISFRVDSDDTVVDVDHAVIYGQIISELLSNALEHAFPDGRSGNVDVSLHRGDGGRVELTVADNGKGLPEDFDLKQAQTLGMRLVHALAGQLSGVVDVDGSKGTRVRITFPEKAS